jgi:hypothetical protein
MLERLDSLRGLGRGEDRLDTRLLGSGRVRDYSHQLALVGILQLDLEQEAVELGLG